MKLKNQNILFLTRTMDLGGTENVILQLCEIFKTEVNNIIVCSSGGINEQKLKDMKIKHYTIDDMENKNPLIILKNLSKIKKIIKNEKITIIHSHHRMAALYANLITDKKFVKLANAHNTFYNKKLLTKLAYKNTKIIAVGEQVKKNLIDYFNLNPKNISVIHNAIKPFDGKIVIDKTLEVEKKLGNTLIANVGRLSEQKGMEYFINAAELVHEKNKKIKFFVIGSGEDEHKLKRIVHEKKLDNFVIFMGFRSDIQNLLSQVDFVVLSSLWEGLPLTPIEAFSVGKTIIATAVDGTVEIVKDNENGLLVKAKDYIELANKINELVNNKDLIKKMEKKAIDTYEKKFSFEKLRENYLDFYKKN